MNVVLAGGRSTRLHNKLLMSMVDGRPFICSALDEFLRLEENVPYVLCHTNQKRIYKKVLGSLYPEQKIHYLTDDYSGLGLLAYWQNATSSLRVLCGDNVYPEGILKLIGPGEAACILSDDTELDGYSLTQSKWVRREELGVGDFRLITPWWFVGRTNVGDQISGVVDLLNKTEVEPKLLPETGWYDIGTPDKLTRYYYENS